MGLLHSGLGASVINDINDQVSKIRGCALFSLRSKDPWKKDSTRITAPASEEEVKASSYFSGSLGL